MMLSTSANANYADTDSIRGRSGARQCRTQSNARRYRPACLQKVSSFHEIVAAVGFSQYNATGSMTITNCASDANKLPR